MVGWWEGVICRQHQGPHLPPIVVVFADYLQDVPSVERDPRLGRQLSNHCTYRRPIKGLSSREKRPAWDFSLFFFGSVP